MAKTPEDVLKLAEESGTQIIDFRFIDLPGVWQHFSIPATEFDADMFTDGLGFDGSSIRGFQQIQESDMLLMPDPTTAYMDPMRKHSTLSIICNIEDPITRQPYSRDPRYIAQKAEAYLKGSGIAETSYWGPEPEFYIFNDVKYGQSANGAFYSVDSSEGIWNSGATEPGGNLGYKIRHKEGYFPVPPADSMQDVRSEMALAMSAFDVRVEVHHHEVGTAGQTEIDMRFNSLTTMADSVMYYKYVIRNVAKKNNLSVTFMPKPIFGDNGSGMHVHQSLWNGDKNVFFDESGYASLSETAMHYIGGILKHTPALLAFTNPTTNSYRRLVPGYEAPVNLAYSMRNRSACVRIPVYSNSPGAKRMEFRCPDPCCNPYLAFPAMLMAGLDGVINKIDPGSAMDKDLYDLDPEEKAQIKQTPGSLGEVLDNLEADHQWLLRGDVFTQDVIDTWISYKRDNELAEVNLRPVPHEFYLYYDL